MKRIKTIMPPSIVALIITAIMTSCGSGASSRTDESDQKKADTMAVREIENEVLEIHDEVMPKMAELNNTRKKLINKLASADSVGYSIKIRQSIDDLEEADSLMWDWMHNYSRPDYKKNLDSASLYLTSELEKVKVMRDKFNRSMTEGADLLEELNANNE